MQGRSLQRTGSRWSRQRSREEVRKGKVTDKELEASENMQSENGKVEVIVIKTENGKLFLMVGNERVEICDFTTRSSAHGETELLVTIKGKTVSTELSANVG